MPGPKKEYKYEYRYIRFEPSTKELLNVPEIIGGKRVWNCINNKSGETLAKIFYYTPWRQYCFAQYIQNAVFNKDCLNDIVNFIEQLNG